MVPVQGYLDGASPVRTGDLPGLNATPILPPPSKGQRDPPYGRQEGQKFLIEARGRIEDLPPLAIETSFGGWA
jgi:hypothetical protein